MSHFITPFRQWFDKTTDAAPEFSEAAALMCLSSIALGKRWLSATDNVHPNLFMLLVGESSIARKSTSVRRAQTIVEEVVPHRIGPSDYTMEALFRWMQGKDTETKKTRNKVVLFAKEYGSDLARMDAYNTTFQTDFCALYDGERIEKIRIKSSNVTIDKPRVSFFGASAYEMMQRYLGPRDWHSGYLMRFLYVAPLTKRPEFKQVPAPALTERAAAVTALRYVRDLLGNSSPDTYLTPQAAQMFDGLVDYIRTQLVPSSANEIYTVYTARFTTNLLKLAVLYQLDEDPAADVGVDAMHRAANFAFGVCWPGFMAAYERTALQEFEPIYFAIVDMIKKQPGVTIREIGNQFSGKREAYDAVELLVKMAQVKQIASLSGERAFVWSHGN